MNIWIKLNDLCPLTQFFTLTYAVFISLSTKTFIDLLDITCFNAVFVLVRLIHLLYLLLLY